MTEQRRRYKTRQREAVYAYLAENADRYLSVDDVWAGMSASGATVGRSTVYRCLESMSDEGTAWKATIPGGESRYRMVVDSAQGQLVCLGCGRALALDCHMVADFSTHVLNHHGFAIDPARTALYGWCGDCGGTER